MKNEVGSNPYKRIRRDIEEDLEEINVRVVIYPTIDTVTINGTIITEDQTGWVGMRYPIGQRCFASK